MSVNNIPKEVVVYNPEREAYATYNISPNFINIYQDNDGVYIVLKDNKYIFYPMKYVVKITGIIG